MSEREDYHSGPQLDPGRLRPHERECNERLVVVGRGGKRRPDVTLGRYVVIYPRRVKAKSFGEPREFEHLFVVAERKWQNQTLEAIGDRDAESGHDLQLSRKRICR